MFCPIWSAGSPKTGPPKPGGREAVAIAGTPQYNLPLLLPSFLYLTPVPCFPTFTFPPLYFSQTYFSHTTNAISNRFFPKFSCIQNLEQQSGLHNPSHRCELLRPRNPRRDPRGMTLTVIMRCAARRSSLCTAPHNPTSHNPGSKTDPTSGSTPVTKPILSTNSQFLVG